MLNHSLCYTCESSKHLFYFSDCLPKSCLWDKSLQSCPTLCDPMDCSLPCSSVYGILQPGIRSGLPFPPPGDLPAPGIELVFLWSSAMAGEFISTSTTWKAPYDHKIKIVLFSKEEQISYL